MGWKHKLVNIYIYEYVAMQDKNGSAISQDSDKDMRVVEISLLRF